MKILMALAMTLVSSAAFATDCVYADYQLMESSIRAAISNPAILQGGVETATEALEVVTQVGPNCEHTLASEGNINVDHFKVRSNFSVFGVRVKSDVTTGNLQEVTVSIQ